VGKGEFFIRSGDVKANKLLEWTGYHHRSASANLGSMSATQGQRSIA
jgi:hypothetical protein